MSSIRTNLMPKIILINTGQQWEVAYLYILKWANYATWTTHEAITLYFSQMLASKLYSDTMARLFVLYDTLDQAEIAHAYGRLTGAAYIAVREAFTTVYTALVSCQELETYDLPPAIIPTPLLVEVTQPTAHQASGFQIEFTWRLTTTIPDLHALAANTAVANAAFQAFLDKPFRSRLQPWAKRLQEDRPLTVGEANELAALCNDLTRDIHATVTQ